MRQLFLAQLVLFSVYAYADDASDLVAMTDVMWSATSGCKIEVQIDSGGRDCALTLKYLERYNQLLLTASPNDVADILEKTGVSIDSFEQKSYGIINNINVIKLYGNEQ